MIIIKMCDPSFLLSTCVQLLVSLSMNNVGSCGSQSGNCHREDGRVLPCQEPGSLSHIFQYNMLLWCDNAELIIYSRFTLSPVFLEAAVQQLVWKKRLGDDPSRFDSFIFSIVGIRKEILHTATVLIMGVIPAGRPNRFHRTSRCL